MTTELVGEEVYLNSQEVAELLNVSRTTVHKLLSERRLISYGPTRRHYFRRSEVLALRDKPKETAPEQKF